MDNEDSRGQESVYSTKVKAGKRRTYFFDVRKTKGEDFYITLTESTKRFNGDGYSRHKLFLYKEDFNRFLEGLQDTIDHVKHQLMPDYDYEQFDRKHEEWDAQQQLEAESEPSTNTDTEQLGSSSVEESTPEIAETSIETETSEDDMDW